MKLARRTFLQLSGAALLGLRCSSSDAPTDLPADAGDDAPPDVPGEDRADADAPDDAAAMDAAADDVDDAPDVAAALDADAPPDGPADAGGDARVDGGATADFMALPEHASDFPLHVMAGEMLPGAAVLWTRYTGRARLALEVRESDGGRVAWSDELLPGADGYTHVEVTGLRPSTRYRYAFLERDGSGAFARSAVGRFRTAPAADALEVVTFGGASCTHQRARPFPTLAHAAARGDLDFFVHAGDMVYCDGARSLAEYRAKYAENWTAAGMRALFAAVGFFHTWDDHEVDNNWNPEAISATTLANARRAYFEHRATRRIVGTPDRIWRSFRWGRTLELFVLDARGERRPSTRGDRDAQYLSRAQMDWLKGGLMRSDAVFKVVVNSVPITDFPLPFDLAGGDRWEGYPAARSELLRFIEEQRVSGVWWLSGDFHLGCVGRVATSGAASRMLEVLAGPGGNNGNLLAGTLRGPQFDFGTAESNYTVFRADPRANAMTVTFVDGRGRELFSRRYG